MVCVGESVVALYRFVHAPAIPKRRETPPEWRREQSSRHSMQVLSGEIAPPRARGRRYWSTKEKFAVAFGAALCWLGISIWVSLPWIRDAAKVFTIGPAIVVISLLAFLPGLLIAFLSASLLLDRQPPLRTTRTKTPLAILIAARNEEVGIAETLSYLVDQDHDGEISVVLVDNGSTDNTAAAARDAADKFGLDLRVLHESQPGKSHALNTGLAAVTTDLVITLDADTLPHPSAVRLLVCRLESSPSDVQAVAGCVLVRNRFLDTSSRTRLLLGHRFGQAHAGSVSIDTCRPGRVAAFTRPKR